MSIITSQTATIECGTIYRINFRHQKKGVGPSCVVAEMTKNDEERFSFCEMRPSEARKLAKALERLADDAETD